MMTICAGYGIMELKDFYDEEFPELKKQVDYYKSEEGKTEMSEYMEQRYRAIRESLREEVCKETIMRILQDCNNIDTAIKYTGASREYVLQIQSEMQQNPSRT